MLVGNIAISFYLNFNMERECHFCLNRDWILGKHCFERHNMHFNIMMYSARCLKTENHMTKQAMWIFLKEKKKIEKKNQTCVRYFFFCSMLFQIIWMPYVCNLSIMTFSLVYIKLRDHYNVGLLLQSCSICLYLFNYMVTCEGSI